MINVNLVEIMVDIYEKNSYIMYWKMISGMERT